jgi:hypothetical protein
VDFGVLVSQRPDFRSSGRRTPPSDMKRAAALVFAVTSVVSHNTLREAYVPVTVATVLADVAATRQEQLEEGQLVRVPPAESLVG